MKYIDVFIKHWQDMISCVVSIGGFSPKVPKLTSDVPVVYKIGSYRYQSCVQLSLLDTTVIFSHLNLLNNIAMIQYDLEGVLTYRKGWRPYVKSVHLSERWLPTSSDIKHNIGDILLTPVVAVIEDSAYQGDPVKFKVAIQDSLKSGDWGLNQYRVKAGELMSRIELHQGK